MKEIFYNSALFAQLLTKIQKSGKTSFYKILLNTICYRKYKKKFIFLLVKALLSIRPLLEPIPVRISGRIYRVPTPITYSRQIKISLKWIKDGATKSSNRKLKDRIFSELLDSQTPGKSFSSKQYKLAQQTMLLNRAFTNYRWK